MHNLDIERDYFDADFGADRNKSGGVNQPFIAAGHDIKFIVNAFKNQGGYFALQRSLRRIDKFYIFRTDDNVDRLVIAESFVDTCPTGTENLYKFVFYHGSVNDIAVSDKIGNKCVFRFVVNVFRSTDLLDISLIHDNNGIGHGQCFFLIVGDIYKSNSKFFFQTDELILHVLAQF